MFPVVLLILLQLFSYSLLGLRTDVRIAPEITVIGYLILDGWYLAFRLKERRPPREKRYNFMIAMSLLIPLLASAVVIAINALLPR